jgi:V8-like Glu-specific endopeptidase
MKGSDERVAVTVTTVLPLHAVMASNRKQSGTASSLGTTFRIGTLLCDFSHVRSV